MKKELTQAWLNVLNIEPKVTVSLTAKQAIDIALEYEKLLSKERMSMTKQIAIDKTKYYKDYKKELQYKLGVAMNLNFKSEVARLENDIQWCKEIIELINDIDSEK